MTTKLDIFADPTCPWCYLGLHSYRLIAAKFDDAIFTTEIHPYFINPDLPLSGMNYQEYLQTRFGRPEEIAKRYAPFLERAEALEMPIHFEKIKQMPNPLHAERLVRFAEVFGRSEHLFYAITRAYFSEGVDIGDISALAALAKDFGIDDAQALLESDAETENVLRDAKEAAARGVQGVPTYIFGNQYVVSGAQPIEFWQDVFSEFDEKQKALAKTKLN